jgi:hypothetical protein
MMNQAMSEEFIGQWKNLFKSPFLAPVNDKQKEALKDLYKEQQETVLASLTAFQDYVKSSNISGNAGDIGKLWQNYLDSSRTLVRSLDSCLQNQRDALFSFLKTMTPQIPTEETAAKKGAERK